MEDKVAIGKIVNTHGIRGELKIEVFEFEEDKFSRPINYYIKMRNDFLKVNIENSRVYKTFFYISLEGYDNINDVEKFKNKLMYIDEKDLEKLSKDSFYIDDLMGLKVIDISGEDLGEVEDILTYYPNGVLVCGDLYIPMVKDYIESVSIEDKTIVVYKERLI